MKERYCEGERFADLSFVEETFEDCDFTDCVSAAAAMIGGLFYFGWYRNRHGAN